MAYNAVVIPVMISSPSDAVDERKEIINILNEWNNANTRTKQLVLTPIGWDTHLYPNFKSAPQPLINKNILEHCDLLIGIFKTRIGTNTENKVSGTVEEIDIHTEKGKPALVYFYSGLVEQIDIGDAQFSTLQNFRKNCKSRKTYDTFNNIEELREKVTRHLQICLNEDNYLTSAITNVVENNKNSVDEKKISISNIDKEKFAKFCNLLSPQVMRFIRKHDFAGPFSDDEMEPLRAYYYLRDDPDQKYTDEELEKWRKEFLSEFLIFYDAMMRLTTRNFGNRYSVVPSAIQYIDISPESINKKADELNDAARKLIKQYDKFIQRVRQKFASVETS